MRSLYLRVRFLACTSNLNTLLLQTSGPSRPTYPSLALKCQDRIRACRLCRLSRYCAGHRRSSMVIRTQHLFRTWSFRCGRHLRKCSLEAKGTGLGCRGWYEVRSCRLWESTFYSCGKRWKGLDCWSKSARTGEFKVVKVWVSEYSWSKRTDYLYGKKERCWV